MDDILGMLGRWQLDTNAVRDQVYRAPTPRERERWYAFWLLVRGWSMGQVAEALGRDAHAISSWAEGFRQQGPAGLTFEQTGGSPPPSTRLNRRS